MDAESIARLVGMYALCISQVEQIDLKDGTSLLEEIASKPDHPLRVVMTGGVNVLYEEPHFQHTTPDPLDTVIMGPHTGQGIIVQGIDGDQFNFPYIMNVKGDDVIETDLQGVHEDHEDLLRIAFKRFVIGTSDLKSALYLTLLPGTETYSFRAVDKKTAVHEKDMRYWQDLATANDITGLTETECGYPYHKPPRPWYQGTHQASGATVVMGKGMFLNDVIEVRYAVPITRASLREIWGGLSVHKEVNGRHCTGKRIEVPSQFPIERVRLEIHPRFGKAEDYLPQLLSREPRKDYAPAPTASAPEVEVSPAP